MDPDIWEAGPREAGLERARHRNRLLHDLQLTARPPISAIPAYLFERSGTAVRESEPVLD